MGKNNYTTEWLNNRMLSIKNKKIKFMALSDGIPFISEDKLGEWLTYYENRYDSYAVSTIYSVSFLLQRMYNSFYSLEMEEELLSNLEELGLVLFKNQCDDILDKVSYFIKNDKLEDNLSNKKLVNTRKKEN